MLIGIYINYNEIKLIILKIKKVNNIRDSFNEKSRQNKKLINNLQLYYVLFSNIQF